MAELFGKATGVSKGRGGSMHIFDLSKRFISRIPSATTAIWNFSSPFNEESLCTDGGGQTGSFPFSEVSSHYEPSESCETNIRKPPVCSRVPGITCPANVSSYVRMPI